MSWRDGRSQGVPTRREAVQTTVVDRRDATLTVRLIGEELPGEGALLEGLDDAGEPVATLVVRRRITDEAATLGILEAVDGEPALVRTVRWTVWREGREGGVTLSPK